MNELLTPEEINKIVLDESPTIKSPNIWVKIGAKAQLAKCQKQDVCPECDGVGIYSETGGGSDGFEECPTCQGTGKKQDLELREKIEVILRSVLDASRRENLKYLGYDKGYGFELDPFIDQIIALIKGNEVEVEL